jgi:hypothetical protein
MYKFCSTIIITIFFSGSINYTNVQLGNTSLQIQTTTFGEGNNHVTFINLHSDETTSIEACNNFLNNSNGKLIQLKHLLQRNIEFNIDNKKYVIDPNRIFTQKGIEATLKKLSSYNKNAALQVEKFANTLTTLLTNSSIIVALHNNGNKGLSIKSYVKGGAEFANTQQVFVNPLMDEDDFIYTTDVKIFNYLKTKKVNVVLQKAFGAIDDGSLSVYAGIYKIPYINIEAQHGHLTQQIEMLNTIEPLLKEY